MPRRESAFVKPDLLPESFGEVDPEDIGQSDEVLEDVGQLGFDAAASLGSCTNATRLVGRQPLEAGEQFSYLSG